MKCAIVPTITYVVTDKMYTITHARYKETDYDYQKDLKLKKLLLTSEDILRSYASYFDHDWKSVPAKELNALADQISAWIDEDK